MNINKKVELLQEKRDSMSLIEFLSTHYTEVENLKQELFNRKILKVSLLSQLDQMLIKK